MSDSELGTQRSLAGMAEGKAVEEMGRGGRKIMVERGGPPSRGYRLRRTSGLGGAAVPYREMRSPRFFEKVGEVWMMSAAVHRWMSAFSDVSEANDSAVAGKEKVRSVPSEQ